MLAGNIEILTEIIDILFHKDPITPRQAKGAKSIFLSRLNLIIVKPMIVWLKDQRVHDLAHQDIHTAKAISRLQGIGTSVV